MTPEQEKQLKEALNLAKENNKMLKKIRNSMFWSKVFKAVYLIIIVGITVGAFYFIQPYLESVIEAYRSVLSSSERIQESGSQIPDLGGLTDLLERL